MGSGYCTTFNFDDDSISFNPQYPKVTKMVVSSQLPTSIWQFRVVNRLLGLPYHLITNPKSKQTVLFHEAVFELFRNTENFMLF